MALAVRTEGVGRIYKIKPTKAQKKEMPGTLEIGARELVALAGVDLEIEEGELFGLLGPNGAGKTTLIKILTTLLAPSFGKASVSGFDVIENPQQVRKRINMVSGGETSGYGLLTVRENLWLFSQLYGVSSKEAYRRADELLDMLELGHKKSAKVSGLSTGERQRMNFCRGFITDPSVLFLDEPTLGLDVHVARVVREFTKVWMAKHPERTVLLTTHYMAEADELCDRIAIVDSGRVLACDTPTNLKRLLKQQPVFSITAGGMLDSHVPILRGAPGVTAMTSQYDPETSHYDLQFILADDSALTEVLSTLSAAGGTLVGLQKTEPTLEDVFIKLVGRSLKATETE